MIRRLRVAVLVLSVVIAVTACSSASSTPILSDEERCTRFGGFWMGTWCRVDGL